MFFGRFENNEFSVVDMFPTESTSILEREPRTKN